MRKFFDEIYKKQQHIMNNKKNDLTGIVLDQIEKNAEKPIIIFKMSKDYPKHDRNALLKEIQNELFHRATVYVLRLKNKSTIEYTRFDSLFALRSNLSLWSEYFAIEYKNPNAVFCSTIQLKPNIQTIVYSAIREYFLDTNLKKRKMINEQH